MKTLNEQLEIAMELAIKYHKGQIDKGVNIDEDEWALSELIQWLFRSCIREQKDINIYIPSKRMRSLLIKWLK